MDARQLRNRGLHLDNLLKPLESPGNDLEARFYISSRVNKVLGVLPFLFEPERKRAQDWLERAGREFPLYKGLVIDKRV